MKGLLLAVAVAAVVGFAWPSAAAAAAWCGTVTGVDRPALVGGLHIRVVYAIPSDGPDASAQWAPQISSDVDEIDAWWRTNDSTRTPRFDLAAFGCGPQVDLALARLDSTGAELAPTDTRFRRMIDDPQIARWLDEAGKVLVYYDGPVADNSICGLGGGSGAGLGIAIVLLAGCQGIPTAPTAAHELIHAFGAAATVGPPNECPDDPGHVCDSTLDILYPFASGLPLSALTLDVNHDDYYGHNGSWLDVRKSDWLRRLDAQAALNVSLRGRGSVTSDLPGIDCAATCSTEFNAGTRVTLSAHAASGQRFVRWSGGCSGSAACSLGLSGATSVAALFAPATFRLAVSVKGSGRILSTAGIACPSRCTRSVVSYRTVILRATPARGWRLKSWGGACRGSRPTCSLPMSAASSARALFVRG